MRAVFRLANVLSAAWLGTVLVGCGAQPDADALYPLEPGLRWEYSVVTERKGAAPERSTRTMENVERRRFAGEPGIAIRRNENGSRYYLAERDDGYYRVAVKSVASHTPIMDQPETKILPLPATVGTSWREPAHAYLLDRARTFISEHAPGNTVTLDYRIEADDVAGAILVLDARPPERYSGDSEPMDARPGHLPGALNSPFALNLTEGLFRSADELADHYRSLGVADASDVVVYCGSGVSACHDLLALEYAGLGRGRLYVGSWSQWSATDRPAATGPDPR